MEESILLKAQVRENTGSRFAGRVREDGKIPVIVYGHKKEPVAVAVQRHNFVEALHHGHRLFNLAMGKLKDTVLVKDIQYDAIGKEIIHADLIRVDVTERVKVNVTVELKGTAKGAEEGGVVESHVDGLEVECVVTEIPDVITVPVKDMEIGDSIHAGEIELPEGVTLCTDPEALVVTCREVTVVKEAEEVEEEEAAPEVIGEAKEEEGAEEGEQQPSEENE